MEGKTPVAPGQIKGVSLKRHVSRVGTFDFVLYGAMIVGTLLNRGTRGDFIYFQF